MTYYEVTFNDELAICLKSAILNPSREQVARFLYEHMNAFNYTEEDIDSVEEVSYDVAVIFYDMKEDSIIPVLGIDEFA